MQRRRRLATAWSLMGSGALALVGGGAFALPGLIHAAPSYVVTNCTTSNTNGAGKTPVAGDLEYEIDQANTTPGTITFSCAPGSTIAVVGTLTVSNTMTINGLSTDNKTPVILDGRGSVQLFSANGAGIDLTLENLTLRNGSTPTTGGSAGEGGAVYLDTGTLDITNVTFSHNTAQANTGGFAGGGAIADNGGAVSITNSTFEDNSATGSGSTGDNIAEGGALLNTDIGGTGAITITGSTFTGNSVMATGANSAAAIGVGGAVATTTDLTIANSVFENNSAMTTSPTGSGGIAFSNGGALFDWGTGVTTAVSGSLFEKNAVLATGDSTVAIGGAMQFGFVQEPYAQGTTTLDTSSVLDNTATANLTGNDSSVVVQDLSTAGGAGIYAFNAPLAVTRSTISDNTVATTVAPGISKPFVASVGGGLVTEAALFDPGYTIQAITIADSTISGNTASEPLNISGTFADGGGVLNFDQNVTITSATVADNAATGGPSSGGGISNFVSTSGSMSIGASIIAENTAATDPDCQFSGTVTDLGYNLESGTDCFGKTPATGDKQNVSNPGLASKLANNGGPTETLALLAGSPAIDAIPDPTNVVSGKTTYNLCPGVPATDQRGIARPQGSGCDIGAYEYQKPTPSTGLSGNGAPHTPITAHTTTHQGTANTLPKLPSSSSLPKLPKLTPQQPVAGSAVTHTPTSGFPLTLAVLLAVLGFALLGSGALVLGRTRKVDGR